ncbi:hypothetical protein HA402_006253 [Bradysia odoriphaga]|nr:hypothetical protein HA402_006253 [Bradysia odoriphaga]
MHNLLHDEDDFVNVYTDGACSNNGRSNAAAGIGVVFNFHHPANYSGPVKGRASKNAAEVQAATWAINAAASMDINQLRVITDSKFLISSVCEWMPQWKRNGWCRKNGTRLANEKDFRFLDRALQRNYDMEIEFEHPIPVIVITG